VKRTDEKGEYFELYAGEKDSFLLEWDDVLGSETIASASSQWTAFSGSLTKISDTQANRNTTVVLQAASGVVSDSEHVWKNRILTSGPPERELLGYLRIKILAAVAAPAEFTNQQLAALREAYAQGVTRVRYGSGDNTKEVEYRSLKEMRELIAHLEGTIEGQSTATPRFSLTSHRRG